MKHVLVSLVLLSACANSSPPASRPDALREGRAIEPTVRMDSPIKVSWEELSRNDTQAVVLAKVERVNKLDMPFEMEVELPAGVRVLEGRTKLTLLANTEAVTVTEKLILGFDAPPAGDAVLKLDGDSGAMGFHYKIPYRFGRAAPEEHAPAATGPAPGKGGKSFGPSVPLK